MGPRKKEAAEDVKVSISGLLGSWGGAASTSGRRSREGKEGADGGKASASASGDKGRGKGKGKAPAEEPPAEPCEVKCMVFNLSLTTDNSELRAAFSACGAIDAKVVTDKRSGKSSGYGYVTFPDKETLDEAMLQMQGTDVGGSKILVQEDPEDSSAAAGPTRRGGSSASLARGRAQPHSAPQPMLKQSGWWSASAGGSSHSAASGPQPRVQRLLSGSGPAVNSRASSGSRSTGKKS